MVLDRRAKLEREKGSEYVKSAFRTLKAILNASDISSNPIQKAQRKWKWSLQAEASEKIQALGKTEISALIQGYVNRESQSEQWLDESDDPDGVFLGYKSEPSIYAATLYLLLIGGRKQDAIELRWEQVDLKEGVITYPRRSKKEKKPLQVPLTGMIRDIIQSQPVLPQYPELVFGMTENIFRGRYNDLIMPLIKQTSKSLRVSWAEHQGLNGFSEADIQAGLNHSSAHAGVTQKNYLKQDLAKRQRLKRMYLAIQTRFLGYSLGQTFADDPVETEDELSPVKIRQDYFNVEKPFREVLKDASVVNSFPTFFAEVGDKLDGSSRSVGSQLVEWNRRLTGM
jgi:integrase